MQNPEAKLLTIPSKTNDPDAQAINAHLNDVMRMCHIGHMLRKVLEQRFNGNVRVFKRWARMNLNKDEKSIVRYLRLAEKQDMLERQGIIRLSEAYALLGHTEA